MTVVEELKSLREFLLQMQALIADRIEQLSEAAKAETMGTPIESLHLSVRAQHCLLRRNVTTVETLTQLTEYDLIGFRNFGTTSLKEVRLRLAERGLHLRGEKGVTK